MSRQSASCSKGSLRMRLHVLASGSRGNAALVENTATGESILVDCGICKREFFARSEALGVDLAKLRAILITHDHGDHTKCLGVVVRGLAKQGIRVPLYAHDAVRNASSPIAEIERAGLVDGRSLAAGASLSLAGLQIHPFQTSHDAADSCGFRFEGPGDALGFMTDTGVVMPQAFEALAGVRVLALEANHDPKMLAEGPYPYVIKRRIASDRGHLSNEQSAEALEMLLSSSLEDVVGMHVSQNNNTYRLPADCLASVVERNGHGARVQVAYQNTPVSVG